MVTIGNSITAGGAATLPQRCWASKLSFLISEHQEKPVKLINSGIGANVISPRSTAYPASGKPAGLERLQKHVFQHNPDLVIIAYGLNDLRGGTPLSQFLEDLGKMVKEVKANTKALIVLVGIYFTKNFSIKGNFSHGSLKKIREWNSKLKKWAKEMDILFTDVYSAMGETEWLISNDGVHPNDLGHQIIANKIFEVLATNCSSLSLKAFKEAEKKPPWRHDERLQKDYGY